MSSHASPSQPSSDPRQAQPLQMEPPPTRHGQGPSITSAAASNSNAGDGGEIHEENVRSPNIKDLLFMKVMKADWDGVINIYKTNKAIAQKAKITRSGETALHLAVSSNKTRVVEDLLGLIDNNAIESMTNDRDENPLHLAASLGLVEICKLIVQKNSKLINTRNVDGEIPLFLTALNGKKGAFDALRRVHNKDDLANYRGKAGDTILHAAIQGECFDLAFEIARGYKMLCNSYNEWGETPLHLLARKPSAFRSGYYLGPFEDLIYHCITVVDKYCSDGSTSVSENHRTRSERYWDILKMFVHRAHRWKDNTKDAEKQTLPVQHKDEQQIQNKEAPSQQTPTPRFNNRKEGNTKGCGNQLEDFSQLQRADIKVPLQSLQTDITEGTEKIISEIKEIKGKKVQEEVEKTQRTDIEVPLQLLQTDIIVGMEKIISEIKEIKGKKVQEEVEKTQRTDIEVPLQLLQTAGSSFLIAARMGAKELVEEIYKKFPVAIWDRDADGKNVVLLVVENKHPNIYAYLQKQKPRVESIFKMVDKGGNSALHLAATIRKNQSWKIPGAALQMQSELKWYKYIQSSMPPHFINSTNHEGKTAWDVFVETHVEMVKDGGQWLTTTSTSCSVVAVLIATVAYASATTVPGGVKETTGKPNFIGQTAFDIFTITSLVALGFSVTSLTMFLSILTSRYHVSYFLLNLPTKLILGLTSLFVSIAAMLVSFCAGNSFVLRDQFRQRVIPIYAITCLPITIYAMVHFPLYFDLIRSTVAIIPERSYDMTSI